MTDATLRIIRECMRHDVVFRWSRGVLTFDLAGLREVLTELADEFDVLGFDTLLIT